MNALRRTHQQLRAQALARWKALNPREQRLVAILGTLIGMLLFWVIAVAPALHTLRDSEQRRGQISQQQAQMLALQAQAQALQAYIPLSREEALRNLQNLAPATQIQLDQQGDRVAAQLKAVPAAALANWLTQARQQAQTLPVEAHLTRSSAANTAMPAASTSSAASLTWDGNLVLSLPSRNTNPSGERP